MEPIQTLIYRGIGINIYHDDSPEDPREWDNLGRMICFHSRYILGDKHEHSFEDHDIGYLSKYLNGNIHTVSLPIFIYDHSGITINTTGFSCPWDSGHIGWIYADIDKIKYEFDWKKLTKKRRERITNILKQEVVTYDQYLRGEVYGYETLDDSCWGYYDIDHCIQDAKSIVDYKTQGEQLELEMA